MARVRKEPASRLIPNSIYKDDAFLELEDNLIQLAYVAALGQVDGFGNLVADPRKLCRWVLPMHRLSEEDVCVIFDSFVEVGLAFYYEAGEELYIHFFGLKNRLYEPPMFPLPEGLTAEKPEKGGRYTSWRVYDGDHNECDADGDPLDGQKARVAPDYMHSGKQLHMQCIFNEYSMNKQCISNAYLNRRERKGSEMNFPFPFPSTPTAARGAGACLGGTPAPAEVGLPLSEEQRRAFLEELSALKGDGHAE